MAGHKLDQQGAGVNKVDDYAGWYTLSGSSNDKLLVENNGEKMDVLIKKMGLDTLQKSPLPVG